ncbi:MAG: hypothetical protein ACR2HJ_05550 [Fimbriimonadales bacterium]
MKTFAKIDKRLIPFLTGALMTVLSAGIVISGCSAKSELGQTLTCKSLQMVDDSGRVRADLSLKNDGHSVALTMFDSRGKALMSAICVDDLESSITVTSPDEQWACSISNLGLIISTPSGPKAQITPDASGQLRLSVRDQNGAEVWSAPVKK